MSEAFRIAVSAEDLCSTVKVHAEGIGIAEAEYIQLVAYKVRVMCAHDRARTPGLGIEVKLEPGAKKARVHPFTIFRKSTSDDEGDAHVVTRYFDGSKFEAFEHYSKCTEKAAGV